MISSSAPLKVKPSILVQLGLLHLGMTPPLVKHPATRCADTLPSSPPVWDTRWTLFHLNLHPPLWTDIVPCNLPCEFPRPRPRPPGSLSQGRENPPHRRLDIALAVGGHCDRRRCAEADITLAVASGSHHASRPSLLCSLCVDILTIASLRSSVKLATSRAPRGKVKVGLRRPSAGCQ